MEERETLLHVPSMTCGGCARRVDAALRALPGVGAIGIALRERTVRVRHRPELSEEALEDALAEAGYPAAR